MDFEDFMPKKEKSPEDLSDLLEHDQADKALERALASGDRETIGIASRTILCSGGGYSNEITRLAALKNQDPDLAQIREKILGGKPTPVNPDSL